MAFQRPDDSLNSTLDALDRLRRHSRHETVPEYASGRWTSMLDKDKVMEELLKGTLDTLVVRAKDAGRLVLVGELKDQAEGGTVSRKIHVEIKNGVLDVTVDGYGNASMEPGASSVAAMEIYEEHLRLLVFGDMNSESPAIIDLEQANEANRKPDEPETT